MTRTAVAYVRRSSGHESPLSLQAQTRGRAGRRGDARGHHRSHVHRLGTERRGSCPPRVPGHDGGRRGRRRGRGLQLRCRPPLPPRVYAAPAPRRRGGHRTAIIDRTGRDLAAGDNRLTAGVLASVDAQVLRDITERNRANRDRKRERGDDLGEAPYGWTKVRLTEDGVNRRGEPADGRRRRQRPHRSAGHHHGPQCLPRGRERPGRAVLLNAAGIPTHRGRKWHNRGVQDMVQREAPEMLPARLGRSHARHYSVRILSGLLRCQCGDLMSPNGQGWTCGQGARGAHGSPYNVTERKVLPWVQDEADRLVMPGDVLIGELTPGEREAIEARRPKLIDLYLDGTIDKAMLDRKLGELDAALERIDRASLAQAIPQRIDWEHESVADINASLRAMWRSVQLGPDMLPVEADWIVPEWRAS